MKKSFWLMNLHSWTVAFHAKIREENWWTDKVYNSCVKDQATSLVMYPDHPKTTELMQKLKQFFSSITDVNSSKQSPQSIEEKNNSELDQGILSPWTTQMVEEVVRAEVSISGGKDRVALKKDIIYRWHTKFFIRINTMWEDKFWTYWQPAWQSCIGWGKWWSAYFSRRGNCMRKDSRWHFARKTTSWKTTSIYKEITVCKQGPKNKNPCN